MLLYGVVSKNRIYGFRRGGYFCPSYGGKKVGVLGSGEYTMDLTKTNGDFEWELFTTGSKYLDCDCEVENGFFTTGSCASICAGAGTAMVFPVGATWAAAMFGGASAAFWFIDSIDLPEEDEDIEDRAQSTLLVRWTRASWGDEDQPTAHAMTAEGNVSNEGTNDGSAMVTLSQTYGVGDTLECFIELESACSARIRTSIGDGIDVHSEAKFECETTDDWNTWKIKIRSF